MSTVKGEDNNYTTIIFSAESFIELAPIWNTSLNNLTQMLNSTLYNQSNLTFVVVNAPTAYMLDTEQKVGQCVEPVERPLGRYTCICHCVHGLLHRKLFFYLYLLITDRTMYRDQSLLPCCS